MKKALLIIAMSLSSFTYAETNFYVSVKTGASLSKVENSKYTYDSEKTFTKSEDGGTFLPFGEATEAGSVNLNDNKASASYSLIAIGTGFVLRNDNVIRAELEYGYKTDLKFSPSSGGIDAKEYIFVGEIRTDKGEELKSLGLSDNINLKVSTQTLMFNGYFDFANSTKFTPYLSTGLGVAKHKYKGQHAEGQVVSDDVTNFAWSLGAGIAYSFNKNLALDFGYKYSDSGDMKFKSSRSIPKDSYTHTVWETNNEDPPVEEEKSTYYEYTGSETSSFKFNNRSHDLTIGLRYTF